MSKLEDIQNRWVELKGVHRLPTIQVRDLKTGVAMTINLSSFVRHLHEPLEDVPIVQQQEFDEDGNPIPVVPVSTIEVTNPLRSTAITVDVLKTMSIDALRLMPEWTGASDRQRGKCATKQDTVDLILAIRKRR